MKKNLFKKALCIILCLASLPFAALADDTQSKTEDTAKEEVTATENDTGLRYDPESEYPVYSGYTPDYSGYNSHNYEMFNEILKLYVDTHLYEFSEDQLTEAFLMKLLRENPYLFDMFLNTLLSTMDPYSSFYEAGTGLASDGSITSYGVTFSDETSSDIAGMGITEPGTYITSVVKGSNADLAGLLPGDRFASVEGIPTDGLTMEAVSYLLKYQPFVANEEFDELGNSLGIPNEPEFITDEKTGKKKYPIHLEVERNGEIIPVTMVTGRAIFSNITYSRAKNKTYSMITVTSFNGKDDVEDFRAAVERAKKESGGNLLIDLRDNLGGTIDHAILMANMLIDEKDRILFYLNSRQHTEPEVVVSDGSGYKFERVTVLVNENTASSSELFAMMARYNCNATIVGTQTYGKAVGQIPYYFSNGDMITITSIEILDPLKRSYHNIGLTPDIPIDLCMKKAPFPAELEHFGTDNYAELSEGSEGDAVMGLEKRLELLGFLRPGYADGKYDSVTTAAIKALKLYYYQAPEELLNEKDVNIITSLTEKAKNKFYYFDSQLEVAEMTFRSNSQAKRRVNELKRASKVVEDEYNAFQKAEEERIKAEEKAAEEEEKRLAEEEAGKEDVSDTATPEKDAPDTESTQPSEGTRTETGNTATTEDTPAA